MLASRRRSDTGASEAKIFKCVVWDLDNTIWEGTLLEAEDVRLRRNATRAVVTLDRRGILQSIASRNDFQAAIDALERFRLREYFLHPQIHWGSKVTSIRTIAQRLNIGLDSIVLVDDEPAERDEVKLALPEVSCIDSKYIDQLPDMPEMRPRFITDESNLRRQMYLADMERTSAEENFDGATAEFLATLDMTFTIALATEADLQRAAELTLRTNQLNTTGYTYSYEELDVFRQSPRHQLWVATLEDKYGSYGKIGLALLELGEGIWTIKLLLMSCRVMSRGVGQIMLSHLMRLAREQGVRLRGEFVENGRNRLMYITYKFTGFREVERRGSVMVLETEAARIQPFPDQVRVRIMPQSE